MIFFGVASKIELLNTAQITVRRKFRIDEREEKTVGDNFPDFFLSVFPVKTTDLVNQGDKCQVLYQLIEEEEVIE